MIPFKIILLGRKLVYLSVIKKRNYKSITIAISVAPFFSYLELQLKECFPNSFLFHVSDKMNEEEYEETKPKIIFTN